MPFCRTHSVTGAPPREPWRWPEPYRTAVGRLVRFRYRLLPYLYTLAHEASRTGHPFVRPLCWPDGRGPAPAGADDRLWSSDDAYLLGDALLGGAGHPGGLRGAPGAAPGRRVVPLAGAAPHGAGDGAGLDTVERLVGTRTVELDTPPGQPLVLVRAGTVLPLDDGWAADGPPDDGRLAPGHGPRRPAVHCFASAGGVAAGGSYDDAGDGYGPGRVDRFNLAAGPSGPVLRWGRDGAYPAPGRLRVVVARAVRHPGDGRRVRGGGDRVA